MPKNKSKDKTKKKKKVEEESSSENEDLEISKDPKNNEEKEFTLKKDENSFKITVKKTKNEIIIQSSNYITKLTIKDLSAIPKKYKKSIDDLYEYIINNFEDEKIIIKDIVKKQSIILNLKVESEGKKTKIKNEEINLDYDTNIKEIKTTNEKKEKLKKNKKEEESENGESDDEKKPKKAKKSKSKDKKKKNKKEENTEKKEESDEEEKNPKKKEKKKSKSKDKNKSKSKDKKKKKKQESDSENEDKKSSQTSNIKTVKVIDTKAIIDQYFPDRGSYHIFPDNDGIYNNKFFAATLNQSDVNDNHNKFYIIQLLQSDSNPNTIVFFSRWGRIGVPGQNKIEYVNQSSGQHLFMKKYRDKIKGGYQEIFIDYEAEKKVENKPKNAKNIKLKKFNSGLDQDILDLIRLIYNKKIISDNLHELGYDSKKMPLGKLSPITLTNGLNILKEIEAELEKNLPNESILSKLSSDFYTQIPHDFGFKRMSNFIINTIELVKQKIDMISTLSDMKITLKILENTEKNEDEYENQEEKQLYDNYKQLNCDIKTINENEEIYKIINKYLTVKLNQNNYYMYGSKLTLLKAYSLNRNNEEKKFKDFGNKKLLWHGTRITNYVGILSQGLRIAPPEAPSSGYLYGKGLYFADMAQKSSFYCYPVNREALILLCEVSLGKEDKRTRCDFNLPKTLESGKNCCHALSRLETDGGEKILDDVFVPNGGIKISETNVNCNDYAEYIVYNVDQVKLKYLLKIRYD